MDDPTMSSMRANFTGRTRDLEYLQGYLADVIDEHGRVVFLMGEAGIGKSRLVEEFFARAAHDCEVQCLRGACLDAEALVPYFPFLEALRGYFEISPHDSAKTVARKIGKVVYDNLDSVVAVVPVIGPALVAGVGLSKSAVEEFGSGKADALQEREHLFFSFYRLIVGMARRAPVLLLLDDLHWSDRATLDLLLFLARKIQTDRILIVGAFRKDGLKHPATGELTYLGEVRNRLLREETFREHELAPLDKDEFGALLRGLLPESRFGQQFYALLLDVTDGNPYYTQQVLRSLLEDKILRQDASGVWYLEQDVVQIAVPKTLRALVELRIGKVDEAGRAELRNAAVIGERFRYPILQGVSTLDEDRLIDYIERFMRFDLVREIPDQRDDEYEFIHGIIREVLYDEMSGLRRKQTHSKIALCIEKLYADRLRAVSELLTHHFLRAGRFDKALPYLEMSAEKAQEAYAFEEALDHYNKALEILDQSDPAKRAALLLARGQLFFSTCRQAEAREDFTAALALATQLHDDRVMGVAGLMLGHLLTYWDPDWPGARRVVTGALPHLERAGDSARLCEAHCCIGTTYEFEGRWDEASAEYARALDLAQGASNRPQTATALSCLGYLHYIRSNWPEALDCLHEAISITEQIGQKFASLSMFRWLSLVYADMGDVDSALTWVIKEKESREAVGQISMPGTYLQLAEVYLEKGDYAQALANLQICIDQAQEAEQLLGDAYCTLARLHVRTGRAGEALEVCRKGVEILERLQYPEMVAYGEESMGIVYEALGYADMALEHYQRALEIAEKLGAQKPIGDAATALGRVYATRGQGAQACTYYHRAQQVYAAIQYKRGLTEVEQGLMACGAVGEDERDSAGD